MEEARAQLSGRDYAQEYLGRFLETDGSVFANVLSCVVDALPPPPGSHDDLVMALALAWQAVSHPFHFCGGSETALWLVNGGMPGDASKRKWPLYFRYGQSSVHFKQNRDEIKAQIQTLTPSH